MTKRGYRDQEGNIIEQSYIINAVFPKPYLHGLFCNQQCQKYMQLLPVSSQVCAIFLKWACGVPIQQISTNIQPMNLLRIKHGFQKHLPICTIKNVKSY